MILSIDHLALCLDSYDEGQQILSKLGYKCEYSVKSIKNPIIKKPFLENFSDTHEFSVYRKENNFSIELINHKKCFQKKLRIIPKFSNLVNANTEINFKKLMSLNERIENFEEEKFNKIVLKVNDIQKSKNFFKILGFKEIEENTLEFRPILENITYQIIFEMDPTILDQKLDDWGFNCIAFISNSSKQEKENFEKNGIITTEIEEILINEKTLKIFFIKGPSSELIEIISPN